MLANQHRRFFLWGEREAVLHALGFTANPQEYNTSVNLTLNTDRTDLLSFTFQAAGPQFRGLITVIAYLMIEGGQVLPIEGGTFQINYEEDLPTAKARFQPWLAKTIMRGLDEWRKRL